MKSSSLSSAMIIIFSLIIVTTNGCVLDGPKEQPLVKSSGVQKMGSDTYSVMVSPIWGSFVDAKKAAYDEARIECAKEAKEMLVLNEYHQTRSYPKVVELTFRCLNKYDPEMQQRPVYRKEPEVIIEDSRK